MWGPNTEYGKCRETLWSLISSLHSSWRVSPPFESLYLLEPLLILSETGQPRDSESFTLFCLLTLEKKRNPFIVVVLKLASCGFKKLIHLKLHFSAQDTEKRASFLHFSLEIFEDSVKSLLLLFCVPDVFRPWIGLSDALAPILHLTVYCFYTAGAYVIIASDSSAVRCCQEHNVRFWIKMKTGVTSSCLHQLLMQPPHRMPWL